MPLTEAGFVKDGKPDRDTLVSLGPSIQVAVGSVSSDGFTISGESDAETVHALIDTGASESCIDQELAEKLNLVLVDIQKVSGVSGIQDHNVYMASVHIPSLNFTQYGRFAAVHLITGGQPHHVLLGRTFLNNMIMIYDGCRAQVTIACPSA